MVLVGVPVVLTVQGGGQTIVAVLLVPLAGGQGGGHVGVVPVAVPVEQGGGQTGCGWVPSVVVLVTQDGTQRTAGQDAPGGQLGGSGQGGAHEVPSAHGGGHGSDFTGTRVRACLVGCRVPCRLCFFKWRSWRRLCLAGLALVFWVAAEAGGPHTDEPVVPVTVAVPAVPVPTAFTPPAGPLASAGTTPTKAPHMQTITSQRTRISTM